MKPVKRSTVEMWLQRLKLGPVVFFGWLVILVSAALILPRPVSKAIAFPILALMLIWFLLSVVALVFYFYRAWRRVLAVPNDWVYIAWMSIETMFAVIAVVGIVWFFATPS